MAEELVLLAVASDGSTEQWDGLPTEKGILLRWQAPVHLGFPPRGYQLFRARQPDFRGILWDQEADAMRQLNGREGERVHDFRDHEVVIRSEGDFGFAASAPHGSEVLHLDPRFPVTLEFPDPAWYLSLRSADTGTVGTTTVEVYSGGVLRETATMTNGGALLPPWRTRGIERVRLSGDGAVGTVMYGLVHAPRFWRQVGPERICLPVSDPSYPCGKHPGRDAEEARRRVPPGVDFDARYAPDFAHFRTALLSLAGGAAPAPLVQGAEPALALGDGEAVALACLDPHLARIAGLLYTDGVDLDGTDYAYRLRGLWSAPDWEVQLRTVRDLQLLRRYGVTISRPTRTVGRAGVPFAVGTEGWALRTDGPVDEVRLRVAADAPATWTAADHAGEVIATGSWPASVVPADRSVTAVGMEELVVTGPVRLTLHALAARGATHVRETLLPSVRAKEPGPPPAPAWVDVEVTQPGGARGGVLADLEWDLARGGSARLGTEPVLYQVAAASVRAGDLPPAFDTRHLLDDGAPVLVSRPPPEDGYYTEFGVAEGLRHWWVRGVDLFGRVSAPAPPAVAQVADSAAPPPPDLVLAEYVQGDLSGEQRALRAPSPPAEEWFAANPGKDGALVVWAWTPELAAQCPDVDGFRVHARRPQPGSGAPGAAETTYENVAWAGPVAELAGVATCLEARVLDVLSGGGQVEITAVTPNNDTHAACATTLSLETGAGALVGARLVGAQDYEIVGNGQGANVTVTVTHAPGTPPATGSYTLESAGSHVVLVRTDLSAPALSADPHRRRIAGVLAGAQRRLAVIARRGGDFLCVAPPGVPPLAPGDAVSWFPGYVVALEDTGFGPRASAATPVAYAQLAVSAVRRAGIEGPPSSPGTIAAVFATPPIPPVLPTILSGEYCAKVATAADWFGISRFTLAWAPRPHEGYLVYRALWEAVWRADLAAHRVTAGTTATVTAHDFPPSALPGDPARRATAIADLAALDAAIADGDPGAITAAYSALRADARQLIAGQPAVEHTYIARNGVDLRAEDLPYLDEFDGRSRGQWFYRVAARSSSGVEGAKSPPTPPICAPDVVGPRPPRVHQALAAPGAVRLRWTRSPDADVARYLLYRAGAETAARDVRDMTLVARLAPAPSAAPAAGEVAPSDVPPWLGHEDTAPAGEWFYRIVAVDADGNESVQSDLLRGRSLLTPPGPPTWVALARLGERVRLSWSHPHPRMSCLAERRSAGGTVWTPVTGWLPRGVYTHDDRPPDVALAWEYRLRVRDSLGQGAPHLPSATLEAV